MQISVFLCKFKMYVYTMYYGKQKTFWEFRVFSAPLPKRSIFLLFVPLLFLLFWIIYRKRKQKRKSLFLGYFCPKTSLFVANEVLIFSDLRLYRANHTPPPVFWHSQGGSALVRKFFIFLFFIFVKYYDFVNSAFLPNFEHFREYHIYFSFCIKFHSIYFCLFLCVR